MEANLFTHHHHHLYTLKPSSFLILNQPFITTQLSLHRTRRSLQILKVTPPTTSSNDSSGEDGNTLPPPPPPTVTPLSDTVEIRFRRGSRKRQKQEELDNLGGKPTKPPPPPKDWEDMTFQEKAIELYVGEKGLLFWLNKFAYASIYIIIGAWIIFRFVGPSLGLYQLDTPPLSPTSILKG